MHPVLPTWLGKQVLNVAQTADTYQTEPVKESAAKHLQALADGTDRRVAKIAPERGEVDFMVHQNAPQGSFVEALQDPSQLMKMASHYNTADGKGHININPNTRAEYLAHELGHHATYQTKRGRQVRDLRNRLQRNPKLAIAMAVAGSGLGLPALTAAMQEGDDDMAESIAIASLLASPTLIDEALATKNGLAIMKEAGMPATPAQRGRLAGAYLTYAGVPIIAGMLGNAVGNVADDYTAIYDL